MSEIQAKPCLDWLVACCSIPHATAYCYSYQLIPEQTQAKPIPTYKAHNLYLDTTLSVGFLGLLPYLGLIAYNFWELTKSPRKGLEAGGIAYLLFTSTWFECGQFTHMFWWLFCLL